MSIHKGRRYGEIETLACMRVDSSHTCELCELIHGEQNSLGHGRSTKFLAEFDENEDLPVFLQHLQGL